MPFLSCQRISYVVGGESPLTKVGGFLTPRPGKKLLVVELALAEEANSLVVEVGQRDEPYLRARFTPLEVLEGVCHHILEERKIRLFTVRLIPAHIIQLVVKSALLLEELMVRWAHPAKPT